VPGAKLEKWLATCLKCGFVLVCIVLGWIFLPLDNSVPAKAVLRLSPVKTAKPAPSPPKVTGPTEGQVYGLVLKVEPAPEGRSPRPLRRPVPESREALQRVTIRLEGSLKTLGLQSDIIQVENVLGENPFYNINLKPGAQVLLQAEKEARTGQWQFNIANHNRTPALMILMTLTIMAILFLGGVEVAKHAFLVTLMLVGCYKAVFPAVLAGEYGLWWIFLMCGMFTILATFIYQQPGQKAFSREQCVVMLGTTGGLLILAAILWAMGEITPLSGYSSDLLASLWYRSPKMDYWAFFVAGMLFAFQGFLFYLCWTLAQNRKESEPVSFQQRFGIVMLRGRRLMGPLISCLGLLFLGLFMPILLQMQGTPTAQFVNLESTASMMTFAFAGALTLIVTVPLTALIAAWLLTGTSDTKVG
jgi:uncharacterized membrane protein